MPGTAPSWRTTALALNAGQLWGSLALPGAGARITVDPDGTPEAVANPAAFHYGATKAGAKLMIKSSQTKFYVDEFRGPIITNIDSIEMGISAELVAVTDMTVITKLLPGVGTYATTPASFMEVRVGIKPITYECVALIFPLIENTAKLGIFNMYSALNDTGVEWAQSRKEMGSMPVSLVGYELTTRAATDTIGNYWKTIA